MQELLPAALEPWSDLIIGVAGALLLFATGWIISRWVSAIVTRVLRRREVDEALTRFLAAIGKYAVLAATVIVALGTVGIQTTGLVALLASAGLAIGLALQGSLSNFASGVMILFFRPFTIGDRVTVAGETGSVIEIGIFATTLRTPENERIIVPNNEVMGTSIKNYTAEGTLRGSIDIGIAYGSDIAKATGIMLRACEEIPLALKDPAPAVVFTNFGASSLDFSLRVWGPATEMLPLLHEVRVRLYDELNENGIEIPFNQIVVHQAEAQ